MFDMALDNTFNSSAYNSYVETVDEMDSLIKGLRGVVDNSKWGELDSDVDKENVIHAVTKDLNSFGFFGALTTGVISPYNMAWPRTGASYQNGVAIANTEIPIFVLDYIARRAIERLEYDENGAVFTNVSQSVKKQKVGSLEQEFFSPGEVQTNFIDLNDMPSFECIRVYVVNSSGNLRFLQRA